MYEYVYEYVIGGTFPYSYTSSYTQIYPDSHTRVPTNKGKHPSRYKCLMKRRLDP